MRAPPKRGMSFGEALKDPAKSFKKGVIPEDLIEEWKTRRHRAADRRKVAWRAIFDLPMRKISALFETPIPDNVDFTTYNNLYMSRRRLPDANVKAPHLWGFGVCSVIVGEFSGWNYGLVSGGLGGLIVASIIATFIYFCVGCMLSELGTTLPFSGGAYAYARAAMGPWGAITTGLMENFEYQLFTGLAMVSFTDILRQADVIDERYAPLLWFPMLLVTWFLLCYPRMFWLVMVSFTVACLVMLIVFTGMIIPHIDFSLMFDVAVDETQWGASPWFPQGYLGSLKALPAALWFYTGFESIAVCIEETDKPSRDTPGGLLSSFFTLFLCMFILVPASCAVPPGATAIGNATFPTVVIANALWGPGARTIWLWLMVIPTLAAMFSMVAAFTRQTYALSRAGYIPKFLSITYTKRRVPILAMLGGSGYAYVGALIINLSGSGALNILLSLTVFCGVVAYMMDSVSYIILSYKLKNLKRPFRSPMGRTGAWLCLILCIVTIVTFLVLLAEFRISLFIFIGKMTFSLFMFVVFGGNFEFTPEELFALLMKKNRAVNPTDNGITDSTTQEVLHAWGVVTNSEDEKDKDKTSPKPYTLEAIDLESPRAKPAPASITPPQRRSGETELDTVVSPTLEPIEITSPPPTPRGSRDRERGSPRAEAAIADASTLAPSLSTLSLSQLSTINAKGLAGASGQANGLAALLTTPSAVAPEGSGLASLSSMQSVDFVGLSALSSMQSVGGRSGTQGGLSALSSTQSVPASRTGLAALTVPTHAALPEKERRPTRK